MIGARDGADALREAGRSLSGDVARYGALDMDRLEIWDAGSGRYVPTGAT